MVLCLILALGTVMAACLSWEILRVWVLRIIHREYSEGKKPMAKTKSVFNTLYLPLKCKTLAWK
jgi:hypothetical protein